MRLSKSPVRVFGDMSFRGKCPREADEQVTFFNWVRREYPATWGRLAFHARNEGLKAGGQFSAVQRHAAEGMTPGAADILIPARVAFVCELKRRDPTLSELSQEQADYLDAASAAGAFACVALGHAAAIEAFKEWLGGMG